MQKIERKNLKLIYDSISENCQWRKKIQDLILWSDNKTIEIPEEMILDGFKDGNEEQKKLIKKYLVVNISKSIIEKCNSFEDVLKISGKTLKEILPWQNPKNKQQISQNGLAKLQLITEVFNEGVELDWKNKNQYKYLMYKFWSDGGWVLDCGVFDSVCYYELGSYFKSEELARHAYKIAPDVFEDFWGTN